MYMYLWVPFIKSFDTDVGVLVRRWKNSIILTPHQQTDSILHLPLPVAEGGREGGKTENSQKRNRGNGQVKEDRVKEKEGRGTVEKCGEKNTSVLSQYILMPYMYIAPYL